MNYGIFVKTINGGRKTLMTRAKLELEKGSLFPPMIVTSHGIDLSKNF